MNIAEVATALGVKFECVMNPDKTVQVWAQTATKAYNGLDKKEKLEAAATFLRGYSEYAWREASNGSPQSSWATISVYWCLYQNPAYRQIQRDQASPTKP
jgi:hypothetical protein